MDYSSKNTCQFKIPVFYPTMEEFKNFPNYIEYIESQGAHKAGLAKIVPPKGWIPRRGGYDDVDLTIPAPIKQAASGNKGLFQQLNIQTKPMTVKEFAKLANSPKYAPPKGDTEELERKFWKNLTFNAPIYGADISGSIYDSDQLVWNVGNLGTILDLVSSAYNTKIEGVNTAYLYFGMWKTSFCWHTEDMDLYSINYLHYGAPKFWYGIPPQNGKRFERLAEGFFSNECKRCPAFLRHKMTHISPHALRRYSIPYDTVVQKAGEFMITFPYAYHAGFNLGYNCAESTNFASRRWIDYGKNCIQCTCSEDMVRIDMSCFVKTYQPSRYDLWKRGLDKGHPEDQGKKLNVAIKSAKDVETSVPSCSFGTVLNDDISRNTSTKIRQISRRHPIVSLDSPKISTDLKKKLLQSRKHKLEMKSMVEEGVSGIKKLKSEHKCYNNYASQLPSCSRSSEPGFHNKFTSSSTSSSDSSSDNDDVSDVSRQSTMKTLKDSNIKRVKGKRCSSLKEMMNDKDVQDFLERVLLRAPALRHVGRLFDCLPFDLNAEFEFHGFSSRKEPHCDVCSLFKNNGEACSDLPKTSRPLVSSVYIRATLHAKHYDEDEEDEEENLLKCNVCNLVVHAGCYGASYQDPSNWICDRCSQADFIDSNCCLCKLRGGALKRTTCDRWVHVTCALVRCQMVLLEGDTKQIINISSAPSTSSLTKHKCSKCSTFVRGFYEDHLIKCSTVDCEAHFHVSCAHRSRLHFYQTKLPQGRLMVSLKCPLHNKSSSNSCLLSIGNRVVAKHKNHRYYKGTLKSTFEQIFCSIEFEDGSFSKDTYPEDIQDFVVTMENHPPLGTPVMVKWSDGEMYNAIFRGISKTLMNEVEFEDGSVLNLDRKHVWLDNNQLPKKIISRLSPITDTKGTCQVGFEVPETLKNRTRGANLKFIRDNNFV